MSLSDVELLFLWAVIISVNSVASHSCKQVQASDLHS